MEKRLKKYFLLFNNLSRQIVEFNNEEEMLCFVCEKLVESGIFTQAFIIRTDDQKGFSGFSYAGEIKNLEEIEKNLKKGFLPECCFFQKCESPYSLIKLPLKSCNSCLFKNKRNSSICINLKFFEKTYGFFILNLDLGEAEFLRGNNIFGFDFIEKFAKDLSLKLKQIDMLNERNFYLKEILEYSNELKVIYNSIPMVMAVLDKNREIVKINSYAEKVFRKTENEAKHLKPGDFFCCKHRFDSKDGCGFGKYCKYCTVNNAVLKTFELKKACFQREGEIEPENRDLIKVLISTTLLNFSNDEYILILIEDITSLKNARKIAEEKALNLSQLVDSMKSGVAVYEYNPDENDFIIKDFNKAAEDLEKTAKDKIIGLGVKKVFPGVWETGLFNCFLEVYKSGIPKKFPLIFYKDSRISGWRENYVYRLENKNIVAVYDDVTDQKIAEEKIKEQNIILEKKEKEYRDIFNNSPVGIFKTTIHGKPLTVNPAMAKILGCKNVDEVYKKYKSLAKDLYVAPERRKEFISLLNKNKKVENFSYEAKTNDNKVVFLEMSASLTQNNRNFFVEGFTRDITKEYKALYDLKISEEKFSKVFMLGSAAMSISDLKTGGYIDVNSSFLKLTGYSKDEVIGVPGSDIGIITKETRDKIYSIINARGRIKNFEIEFYNKKGEKLNGLYSGDIILLNSKPSLLSTTFDITQRKIYEQEAIRAGQLAQIGELAAGVAHEINNSINGIINYAQILIDEFEKEGRDNDIALRIIKEGERISKIAGSLLNFAGNQKEEFLEINIYDVLKETMYLGEVQIKKDGINLINEFPENLAYVRGRQRELEQVFFNILLNSRYALNEKYPFPSEEKIIRISGSLADHMQRKFVKIEFFDSGTGILPKNLRKIKSPFFSTKPRGKGTGLGLSLSSSIIERHFGNFEIESVFNEYTKIIIELPIAQDNEFSGGYL
ncbi:MAG: PAS domain S-box protein [Desulforegulaceae bacterium]|nr:PAS domain S-box protein [Desulforegulaceae bacterium]